MKRGMVLGLVLGAATLMSVSSAQAQTSAVPLGAGTVGSPYQISQLGHLVWMGENVGSSTGKCYTVQNDIDASVTAAWNGVAPVPIGAKPAPPFQAAVTDASMSFCTV